MRTGSIRDGKVPTAVLSETEELYRAMGVPERVSMGNIVSQNYWTCAHFNFARARLM